MGKPLRVLIVEDSETDALLLVRELRRGGYEPSFHRVDSADGLREALENHGWDLIICDYKMPAFDGPSALAIFQAYGPDIPFIVVSGMIGEDVAVAMMTAGAHDYLLKHNLARLIPAIERELREAEERRDLRRAEEARSHLAAVVESSDDGIISTSSDGRLLTWNTGAEKIFGYSGHETRGQHFEFLIAPPQKERIHDIFTKVVRGESVNRIQTICLRKDFRAIDVSLTISAIKNPSGEIKGVSAIARDITDRKRAEAEREKLLRDLQQALSEVKTLSGLLPICASCKKIRDDEGYWHQVEVYVQRHSRAAFTHGFCPECMKRLYPQFVSSETEVLKAKLNS